MAGQQIREALDKAKNRSGRTPSSKPPSGVLDLTEIEPVRQEVGV
jgi:hypothetical protein